MFATYYNPGAAATGDASHVGLNGQNRVAEISGGIPNTLNVGTVNGIPTSVAYNPYLSTPYNVAQTTYGQPVGIPTVGPIPGVNTPVTGWNTIPTTSCIPTMYNQIPTATPFGWVNPINTINPMLGVNPFAAISPWAMTSPTMFGHPTTSFGLPFNPMTAGVSPFVNPSMIAASSLASTINPITGIPTVFGQPLVNPMNIASTNPFINPFSRINPLAAGTVNPFVGINPITGVYGSTIPGALGIPGAINSINPFCTTPSWNHATGLNPFSAINPLNTIGANPFTGTPLGLNPFICASLGINPFCGSSPIGGILNNPAAINPWNTTSWANNPLVNSIANPLVNPLVTGLNSSLVNPMMNPFINATAGLNPWAVSSLSAAACGCSPVTGLNPAHNWLNAGTFGSVPTSFGNYGWNGIPTPAFAGLTPTTVNPFACGPTGCF